MKKVVFIIGFMIANLKVCPTGFAGPNPGDPAPSFTLQDLDKNEVVLDSLLTRGPVVLDFWATWCKPCLKELDFWEKLKKEFGQAHRSAPTDTVDSVVAGLNPTPTFVAINEDGPQTQRKVPLFVKSRGWTFLVLIDDKKVMSLYQVKAIPHTFIIGKNREILYQHIGFTKKDEDVLRKKLKSISIAIPDTLEKPKYSD